MLRLNLKRAFRLRGIENPTSELVEMGISRPTVFRLLNNDKSWVSYEHLEKVCAVLNCTPNDLFEWYPSGSLNLPENHALYALRRDEAARSLKEIAKDIPLERMGEIENLLSGLKNE